MNSSQAREILPQLMIPEAQIQEFDEKGGWWGCKEQETAVEALERAK